MKYYVRHQYRISTDYNTFDMHPWHGAGQGAADTAIRYIVLSDSLIDTYHEHFQPRVLHDPTMTMQIIKSIKAFIDDVAMSAGDNTSTFSQIVQRAQNQLHWWNQLVQSSGGALNPKKCCGALYHWQPDNDGILCSTEPDPTESAITIEPGPSSPTIPILKRTKGTRYLSVYVTRNGSTKVMEEHIWKQAVTYTKAFQRTHMSQREANVLYWACFLPALVYSFPATWLPDNFLERIHTLSTSTILNKMGLHRNLLRSLVFAPRQLGGIGLTNLIHEHGVQQVLILFGIFEPNQTSETQLRYFYGRTNSGQDSDITSSKTPNHAPGYRITGFLTSVQQWRETVSKFDTNPGPSSRSVRTIAT